VTAAAAIGFFSMNRTSPSSSRDQAKATTAESAVTQAPAYPEAAAASAEPARTAPAAADASAGSTYFVDPVTRQPHAPSVEELQTLAAGRTIAAPAQPQPIVGVNGAPGLRLTDEQMTYAVATKNADGSVSVAEADGKTEALEKVRASAGGIKAGKEQGDVR